MNATTDMIRRHYEAAGEDLQDDGNLVSKVVRVLDGLPDGPISAAQLAGLDQFNVRGLAATAELAEFAGVQRETTILDAGSGLGGPSRYLADTYGCSVVGVDLTPAYVAIAQLLAERTGLSDLVRYEVGDLLAPPFADASFDMVWTQHVVMNIRDRDQLYREFRRVLKPGGTVAFYDVLAAEGKPEPYFPAPWAASSETSYLLTETETIAALMRAGLTVNSFKDVTAEALAWFSQQFAQQPAPQGLSLATVMGSQFAGMAANLARSVRDGRVRLVMGACDA